MIHAENIHLTLGDKTILKDVSVNIEEGTLTAIYGESGSGKSSLLKTFIGFHQPTSGRITIAGMVLEPANLPRIRSRVFYMPQEVRPVDEETVREFIDMFFSFKATRHLSPDADGIARAFGSLNLDAQLLDEPMSTLSGGERQRVGLARGLLLRRDILLLDEVTSAVDGENRDRIVDHLTSLEGVTVVAVTHSEEIRNRADLKLKMKGGGVAESG